MQKRNIFLLLSVCFQFVSDSLFSQNIGIGISNPLRAKLEVNGVAGVGATSAIFGGDATGISLQRNWPTIGFNQYRDVVTPGSQGKYMANGFAAIQYFDPTTGAMAFDMFSNGTINSFTPLANRAITILSSGNVGIHSGGSTTASLYVTRGTNTEGTAIFGGTQHGSYFNYSSVENTYIRPGKDAGTVFLNDVPNGKIVVGANGNNTLTTINGDMLINNTINLKEIFAAVTGNNVVVDASNTSSLVFTSDDEPGNRRVLLTGTSARQGQLLILRSRGTNGFNGVKIVSTFNNAGSQFYNFNDKDLKNGTVMMLIWDGTTGWMMVSYSDFFD